MADFLLALDIVNSIEERQSLLELELKEVPSDLESGKGLLRLEKFRLQIPESGRTVFVTEELDQGPFELLVGFEVELVELVQLLQL